MTEIDTVIETECADCRAYVDPDDDRNYPLGDGFVLCAACAARRGGAYDSIEGRWVTEPNLSGVPDERRPHP